MIKKFFYHLIRNKYFIYSSFGLITFITLVLTLLPSENLGQSRLFQYDKIGHFLLFFFWTVSFGLLVMIKKPARFNIIFIVVAGSLFGIVVEIIQYIMPFGRSLDFYDAIADILGSISAGFTLYYFQKWYNSDLSL